MFCSKCGKEINDEAVICVHCGCSTNAANTNNLDDHPVIKTSYGRLLAVCMVGGLFFGAVMGISLGNKNGLASFIPVFLGCSLGFGLLMFGAFVAFTAKLNDTVRENIRKTALLNKKIYLEGAANRSGNGGWLFVTENAIEHHVHAANLDNAPTIIEHKDIILICKSGKQLLVRTNQKAYFFVVDNVDQWMTLLLQCKLTNNKIQ